MLAFWQQQDVPDPILVFFLPLKDKESAVSLESSFLVAEDDVRDHSLGLGVHVSMGVRDGGTGVALAATDTGKYFF